MWYTSTYQFRSRKSAAWVDRGDDWDYSQSSKQKAPPELAPLGLGLVRTQGLPALRDLPRFFLVTIFLVSIRSHAIRP